MRKLLFVCLLVAIAVGWHRYQMRFRQEAIDAILAAGGGVEYAYEAHRRLIPAHQPIRMWLAYSLGFAGPQSVHLRGPQIDDDFIKRYLLRLDTVEQVWLEEVTVTDTGLTSLAALPALRSLGWHRQQDIPALKAVHEPTMIDIVDLPLVDLLAYLSDLHKVPFSVDKNDLQRGGRDVFIPLSANIVNVPLATALNQLLVAQNLDWSVGNGGIIVMSKATADLRKHQKAIDGLRASLPTLSHVQISCDVPNTVAVPDQAAGGGL